MSSVIYGKKPFKQETKRVTSKVPQVYGFAFPIKNTGKGYFNKVSGVKLALNNLKQLLMTERGERVMLPNFGANLNRFLFEPLDQQVFEDIRDEILNTIEQYAKGVTVRAIRVFPDTRTGMEDLQRLIVQLFVVINNISPQTVQLDFIL